jgi:hypothetical protein
LFQDITLGDLCYFLVDHYNVQRHCFETTIKASDELEKWFPTQDVMDVLALVYPEQLAKIFM